MQRVTPHIAGWAVALCSLLAACTDLSWPRENFVTEGGSVKTIQVVPRPDACDPDAYINGYRAAYVQTWNQAIQQRMDALAAAKQQPGNTQAEAEYQAYQQKLFKTDSLDRPENRYAYVPPSVMCESDSEIKGRSQGSKDALRDLSAGTSPKPPQ